jgi:putative aminopeptidase FrvX
MTLPEVDKPYFIRLLTDLLNIPSPTGFTEQAIEYIQREISLFPGITCWQTRKGSLVAKWEGQQADHPRALTAHVDTLGAMVKEIKENGRLRLSKLGGYAWNTVEGEGCQVMTRAHGTLRGSILLSKASAHVYGQAVSESKREDENMEVRLDIVGNSAAETAGAGVQVGDCVAFDPRVELVNGFVRSRHLDDKACVANLISAVKSISDAGLKPLQNTFLLFSNYEEVGHGAAAGIPPEVEELLAVDMAAIGAGQTSHEQFASICVKDSGGPYHHGLSSRLRDLADRYQIPYKVDIYPYYGSDGESFWRAGGDVRVALIGPGVDASHNYERTHLDGLLATTNWVMAYLLE